MVRPQDLKNLPRAGALEAIVVGAVRAHWYIRVKVGHGGSLVCALAENPIAFAGVDAASGFLSDYGIDH